MQWSDTLEVAHAIGCGLARDASWHEDRCNWLSPANDMFLGQVVPAYKMLGPILYDGTAGVGLFLAHLAVASDDPVIKATACGAIRHALSRIEDVPKNTVLGFHTGYTGIAYAAMMGGTVLGQEEISEKGRQLMLETLAHATDGVSILDVIVGLAGAIPALLALRHEFSVEEICLPLLRWGDSLVAAGETCARGISWDTTAENNINTAGTGLPWTVSSGKRQPNLLGIAHGAGGIGLALLELAAFSGEARYRRVAEQAFAYEESWFDHERGYWPDLRYHDAPDDIRATHAAWCHGAAGIGLTRIRAWELTSCPAYKEQALRAMHITTSAIRSRLTLGTNFCLCHGIAGNADLFLNDSVGFGDAGRQTVDDVLHFGQEAFHASRRPWPYGEPNYRAPVGLMSGLAGTGLLYLRAADPAAVPSVLLLREVEPRP